MPEPRAARLRVMHVCAPAEFGGLERVVADLCCGLVRHGHDVTMIAVVEPGANVEPLLQPMQAAGVRAVGLEVARRGYLAERRQVARWLDDVKPHVLHTHGHRPDLLHPGIAKRKGVGTVTTLHGFSMMGGLSTIGEWLQERSLRRFDAVVAVSRPLATRLASIDPKGTRVHCLPNAWTPPSRPVGRAEARRVLGIPNPVGPVIGWVGRLYNIKGPDVFINALASLPPGLWMACIVGDGPDRAVLERSVRDMGLTQRVHFAGAVPEAANFSSAFDLFALTSRSEGTPMVLLEAMGAGVPIVATAVGGVPDMVGEACTGWLVPPENPTALAEALNEALSNPGEASRRAVLAHERLQERFSADAWIQRHEALYFKTMGESADEQRGSDD